MRMRTPEPETGSADARPGVRISPARSVRLAIPAWNGYVSPVFDCAEQLLVVDLRRRHETARRVILLTETNPARRAQRLVQIGVRLLLCGAVTRPLEELLVTSGIRVCSRLRGAVDDVLTAYLEGKLGHHRFCLPGCCRGHRRCVPPRRRRAARKKP